MTMTLPPERLAEAAQVILEQRKMTLAARTQPVIAALPADKMGCGYIRMMVPFKALRAKGYDVVFGDRILTAEGVAENAAKGIDIFDLGHLWTSHNGLPCEITEPAVIVMQRQTSMDKFEAALALQARGTKIVFEFDDSFHTVPHDNPNAKDLGVGKPQTIMLEKFVAMADMVIVSTQHLADEYARFSKRIVVCENALDDAQFHRFQPKKCDGEPKRAAEIRIGWGGSATHVEDFRPLVKPLCKLMDEFPAVRVVFCGADMRGLFMQPYFNGGHPAVLKRNRVEFAGMTHSEGDFTADDVERPIAPVAYYDLLNAADLDIALAPIRPMTFNRSKSWIKLLEYGMLGVPTVASNFGPYRDFDSRRVQNDVAPTIWTANDPADWHRILRRLVMFPEERARMAQANRDYVGEHHLISKTLPVWERALASLGIPTLV